MREYNELTQWRGIYRGVHWSINRFDHFDKNGPQQWAWCHYLHIALEQLPEEQRESFWLAPIHDTTVSGRKWVHYDYYHSPLGNLDWHGEITFYEKNGAIDDAGRYVKAGCDYQHLWDTERGEDYSFRYVLRETYKTIDSLHDQIPGVMARCCDGYCCVEWHKESNGHYKKAEDKSWFVCLACEDKIQKELQEKAAETRAVRPSIHPQQRTDLKHE